MTPTIDLHEHLNDLIDDWHHGMGDHEELLPAYLGMTEAQYTLFVMDPDGFARWAEATGWVAPPRRPHPAARRHHRR